LTRYNIQKFLTKLNRKTGQNYRLPTEAEWEYAARSGGKKEKWSGTSNASKLIDYGWYKKNSNRQTHPVGAKKPNGLGLYDMSGNVWEWCSDWYDEDYYKISPVIDPKGPYSGKHRVLRGGSWLNLVNFCRLSYRYESYPDYLDYGYFGFRFAQVIY
jgi:formylglycine-generating enzyme